MITIDESIWGPDLMRNGSVLDGCTQHIFGCKMCGAFPALHARSHGTYAEPVHPGAAFPMKESPAVQKTPGLAAKAPTARPASACAAAIGPCLAPCHAAAIARVLREVPVRGRVRSGLATVGLARATS